MKRYFLILGFYLFFGTSLAWSDATIEMTFKSSGIRGIGAMEGNFINRYQGAKKYEEMNSKFTGPVLSRIVGGAEEVEITRVDKGLYWKIDHKARTYTETAIEMFKKTDLQPKKEDKEQANTRITKSEFTVKKTGASEKINGFPCSEYVLTWLLEWENLETKARSRGTMDANLWTTPETATIRKAQADEQFFYKAYAQKVGITYSPREGKQFGIEALATMTGASPKELEKEFAKFRKEMSKVKGYPIRSTVSWSLEGDKGATKGDASPAGAASGGGISGVVGGLAVKLLQKKESEKTQGGKDAPFFESKTEVKTIDVASISGQVFELPSGYVKK